MIHKGYLFVLGAATCLAAHVTPAYAADMSKADVEKIVADYIRDNGAALSASLERYLVAQQVEDMKASIAAHSPTVGPDDALVTVVEYGDYRCGYCRKVQETVAELRRMYDGRVRFAYKALPILSDISREAAQAAYAAHKQGKFWEYNAKIWEDQQNLSAQLLDDIAKEIKLDISKFERDRKSPTVAREIERDLEDARLAGARGTPFFVINGTPLSGAQPKEEFVRVIEAAFDDVKK